ncbi:MAG: pitrilysin family protein [Planctomycetota bacterium]
MSAVDRTHAPGAAPAPEFRTPTTWRETLAGGATLVGTQAEPLAFGVLALAADAGQAFVPPGKAGLASLAAEVLLEGTARLDGTELQDELDGLGADLSASAGTDSIVLQLSGLERHLDHAAELLLEVVREPRFDAADVARLKRQRIARLEARASDAARIAGDAWQAIVHGDGTSLGQPSAGTPAAINALTRDELATYWEAALDPAGLRAQIVSAREPERARGLFAGLAEIASPGRKLTPDAGESTLGACRRITLVDRPGAPQSYLRVGHLAVPATHPDFYALYVLNHPLGGAFSSRLNLNLREDKGWTYGVRSGFGGGLRPGTFQVAAAVETDASAPAVAEIVRELEELRAGGVTADELEFARESLSQTLLRQYESVGAKAALVSNLAKYGWPADYPARRLAWLAEVSKADLDALAERHLHLDRLEVLAVGDAERIRGGLEDLGFEAFEVREAG